MSHKYEDSRKHHDKYHKRDNDNRNRERDRDRGADRDRDRDSRKSHRNSDDREQFHRKRRYSSEETDDRVRRNKRPYPAKTYQWGKEEKSPEPSKVKEKEKPNFEPTGKLAEETNSFRGVVIKYSEPQEARIPKRRWRLYPFKGEKELPVLHIHRQSGYLMGRDRKIADIAVDHPSCSKQHAAFQYRLVPVKTETGKTVQQVKPYIMDLESANGTYLNNKRIEPRKYYELLQRDVLKFGFSTREYVLLHEDSKEDEEADNIRADEDGIKEEKVDIKEEEVEDIKEEVETQ